MEEVAKGNVAIVEYTATPVAAAPVAAAAPVPAAPAALNEPLNFAWNCPDYAPTFFCDFPSVFRSTMPQLCLFPQLCPEFCPNYDSADYRLATLKWGGGVWQMLTSSGGVAQC